MKLLRWQEELRTSKNDGVLPIDKTKVNTIGVIGPNTNSRAALVEIIAGTSSEYVTVLEESVKKQVTM